MVMVIGSQKKCVQCVQSHLSLELAQWRSCYTDGPGSTWQHGPMKVAWHRWLCPPCRPSGSPSAERPPHQSPSERRNTAGLCIDGHAHTCHPHTHTPGLWGPVCQQTALHLIRGNRDMGKPITAIPLVSHQIKCHSLTSQNMQVTNGSLLAGHRSDHSNNFKLIHHFMKCFKKK